MESESPIENELETLASRDNLPAVVDAREITPNAFEEVMSREKEIVLVAEPFYKNRAFIAAICIIGGVLIGKMSTVESKVIEKSVSPQQPLVATKTETDPKNLIFRNMRNLSEFDPWDPMNGGFPLPPQETQARLIESYTAPVAVEERPVPIPRPLQGGFNQTGEIVPIEPGAALPPINGGSRFPKLPSTVGQKENGSNGMSSNQSTAPDSLTSERYVSMVGASNDPEQAATKAINSANGVGGYGRSFVHMTEEGSVEAHGAILLIPASKFDAVKSQLLGLGEVKIDGTIAGDPKEHQSAIQGMFNARLAKLRDKRKELLVDFLEDAQPVRLINDAIEQESRALQATRLSGKTSGRVAIRILFK